MIKRSIVRTQVVVLVFAFVGVVFAPTGEAACEAPRISVIPTTGSPGSNLIVSGEGWAAECNDTISCQTGQQCTEPPPSPPSKAIAITLKQGDRSWPLATVDAAPDYAFKVSSSIPSDAQPGAATIEAPPAQPASFRVGPAVRTQIGEKKEKLKQLRGKGRLKKQLRDRMKNERFGAVADADDQDVWVAYVFGAFAIVLIGLGVVMIKRQV